ncbi:MAG: diguanylate cyclase [Desulfobaccales bacterium]
MDLKRIFTHWPFRSKLLLFLLIILLPALGIIVATGVSQRQHAIVKAQDDALLLVRSLVAQQEQIAIATKTMLSTLAQLPEVQNLEAPACNRIFAELYRLYPFYASILAMTPDGYVFAAHSPFDPGKVNQSDRKYFRDAVSSLDFSAGEYIIGRVSKTTSFNYSVPVLNANKKLVAVLTAGLNVHKFGQFISAVNLPEGSVVAFTDYKGIRLYRLPENDATPIGKAVSQPFFDTISGKAEEGLLDLKGPDGVTRIMAFRRLRLKENLTPYFYIIVGLPKGPILHQANMNMLGNLAVLGIATLLAMSLAWVFGNLVLINPINRLVAATQRFGMGKMDTRTNLPHSPDELGRLARSFDDMASLLETRDIERERAEEALNKAYGEMEERVQERTAELTASNSAMMVEISERNQAEEALRDNEQKYRLLTATVPAVVFRGYRDGAVEFFDEKVAEVVGYEKEDFNSRLKWTDLIYPEDLEPAKAILRHALATNGYYVREYRFRHRDDRLIWIQERSQIVLNQQGKIDYISGVFFDITDRRQSEEALRSSKEELTFTVQALEKRNYELTLLTEMGDMLQSCVSTVEAHGVIGNFLQQIFPEDAGAFSVIDGSRKLLKVVVVWGGIPITQEVFPKEECWALRTGRILGTSEHHAGLCHHPDAPRGVEFLCLPMVAQGDAVGVLRLQCRVSNPCMDESKRQLAVTVAEHINLALANLLLRETLHHQSIRDPLTGLYNRRYLEEAMKREIYRAARNQSSLGLIMLDVDQFKQFNDRFGHDAGDELLRELGNFLMTKIRQTDIACRYGGEEFFVILPGTALATVVNKAKQLREKFKRLTIVYQGGILGRTTISLGVAAFPEHGITPKALIQTVDKALYKAKAEGRDRVVVAPVVREGAEAATESGAMAAS